MCTVYVCVVCVHVCACVYVFMFVVCMLVCVCVCVSMCVCGHWWLSGLHLIESLGAQAPACFPFNIMMAIHQTSSSHQSTQL